MGGCRVYRSLGWTHAKAGNHGKIGGGVERSAELLKKLLFSPYRDTDVVRFAWKFG